jgi:hypothetical protein
MSRFSIPYIRFSECYGHLIFQLFLCNILVSLLFARCYLLPSTAVKFNKWLSVFLTNVSEERLWLPVSSELGQIKSSRWGLPGKHLTGEMAVV